MDTHTAVAENVYEQYVAQTHDTTKTVIASTASPFKFSGSVVSAIMGEDDAPLTDDEFVLIEKLSEISRMTPPKSLSELKDKEVRFPNVTKKEEMILRVDEFLA